MQEEKTEREEHEDVDFPAQKKRRIDVFQTDPSKINVTSVHHKSKEQVTTTENFQADVTFLWTMMGDYVPFLSCFGCLKIAMEEMKHNVDRCWISLVAGGAEVGYDSGEINDANSGFNVSIENNVQFKNFNPGKVKWNSPSFIKYRGIEQKLYISDYYNHIIRSIEYFGPDNDNKWIESLKIEVGHPKEQGFQNGSNKSICKLSYPRGFDWDSQGNMFICSSSFICKVDASTCEVSFVSGHTSDLGWIDGNNEDARFCYLSSVLCWKGDEDSEVNLFACDERNYCIRMIGTQSNKTITYAGKGKEKGDQDGSLEEARFYHPWDIICDQFDHDLLYISDSLNHKIKTIHMKQGIVKTWIGDEISSITLSRPQQMKIIDHFMYVACSQYDQCVARIDKRTREMIKVHLRSDDLKIGEISGITYNEQQRIFYISDDRCIYHFH